MEEFIGSGELTLVQILKELFPTGGIQTQVKVKDLLKGDFKKSMSTRQEIETIDVLLELPRLDPIVLRVQGKDHLGSRKSQLDKIQERILRMNRYKIIDVWYYEAPELFRDKLNNNSRTEVKWILKRNNIRL